MSYIGLTEAREQGFTIDENCYPWVAYKGPRFNPTEWHYTQTDTEHDQAERIEALEDMLLEMGERDG